MRFSTLEIRWHDTKPIFACDFQPFECVQHKRQLNPYQRTADNVSDGDGKLWRVATAGGDNNIRIWLAIPNPPPQASTSTAGAAAHSKAAVQPTATSSGASANSPYGKPKVEYLSTLDKHTLTVNVVRFSPSGHTLATAGDDAGSGGILLWRLSANAAAGNLGNRSEDALYAKEHWQAFKVLKTSSPEVYDLVWSPDGQYILAGGTDGAARIHRVADGICVAEMKDHKDWVQGVAWDPLNKFIATQSKDRQMFVYSLSDSPEGSIKVTPVSKNTRLSTEKPATAAVDANGSASPAMFVPSTSTSTHTQVMYGDEESTPFFRRLAFSPDGALLVTPAGQYEDPSAASNGKKGKRITATTTASTSAGTGGDADTSVLISSSPAIEKKAASSSIKPSGALAQSKLKKGGNGPAPTSYIFARGQLANETPVAHLPGHRTTSVVVKFNPILWNARTQKGKGRVTAPDNVVDAAAAPGDDSGAIEGADSTMQIDGETSTEQGQDSASASTSGTFRNAARTIYAIATHETILVYDTQQETPICMFGSLHFAAFTDLAWTADGLTLIATSSDGYASMFTFEEGELGTPAAEQPKRMTGPVEDTLSTLSPAKASTSAISPGTSPQIGNNGSSLAFNTSQQPASTIFAAPITTTRDSTDAKQSDDVILLSSEADGVPPAQNGEVKKVKKRVALTHVGPLSG